MLEREDGTADGRTIDNELTVDSATFNTHTLIAWIQSHEQWAKQILREDHRYGEASLMLTYAKELFALLECSTAMPGEDAPMCASKNTEDIAALVQRIAELRTRAHPLRRDYSGRGIKRIG